MKPGDKVRVRIDTNGGYHPLVGTAGYYTDTVRAVFDDLIVLTHVSWMPEAACEPTDNYDALVKVDGREHLVRMLDRGKVWWAKLPGALEPIATAPTYDEALRAAVRSLH